MSKGVESLLIMTQESVVLPITEPIVAKDVHVIIRVRNSEPKLNQHNGNIVKGVPKDWSIGIHSVKKVPRPNFPCCTYCY
jgi:hypothetical protein